MKQYIFTIKGNHQDPFGNAFPKLKMTGKQHWTDKAQNYVLWKKFVQSCFIKEIRLTDGAEAQALDQNIAKYGKPIVLEDCTATMDIQIAWKDGHHGDPENIFGSIADALFHNDKNLYGSFSPLEGKTGGEVRCIISVSDPTPRKSRRTIKRP